MHVRIAGLECRVAFVLVLAASAAPAQAGYLFATNGASLGGTQQLFLIDQTSGATTQTIGNVGQRVAGLAFDPYNATLYGTTAGRATSRPATLVTIDYTGTGAATVIGSLLLPAGTVADITYPLGALGFGVPSVMYGWTGRVAGSDLVTIDTTTAEARQVFDTAVDTPGAALAWSDWHNWLYLGSAASGPLYLVDPAAGEPLPGPTLFGAPLPDGFITALAFDVDGTLYGINSNGGFGGESYLVRIAIDSGEVTNIGRTVDGVDAITFFPYWLSAPPMGSASPAGGVNPEPSSLVLVGFGLAGLGGYAWRRRRRVA